VVTGGGISGLAAALFLKRQAGARHYCLLLENHAIFGGEARRNEFLVDGRHLIAHQGRGARGRSTGRRRRRSGWSSGSRGGSWLLWNPR